MNSNKPVDYLKHFEALDKLLDDLGDGRIEAIYFGNKDSGDHHHRIQIMATAGGTQVAFHRANISFTGPTYGSGEYIGLPGNKEIIRKAQEWLQDYYKIPNNKMVADLIQRKRERENFEYYSTPVTD